MVKVFIHDFRNYFIYKMTFATCTGQDIKVLRFSLIQFDSRYHDNKIESVINGRK